MGLLDYVVQAIQAWFAHITHWIIGSASHLFDVVKTLELSYWNWLLGQLPTAIGGPLKGVLELVTSGAFAGGVNAVMWFIRPIINPTLLLTGFGWMIGVFLICVTVRLALWIVSLAWPGAGAGV
jgi:hypothetical protein